MAALQSIRRRGKLLMIILGLALFAFIAETAFQSLQHLIGANRMTVGTVYGESLSQEDYYKMVDDMANAMKSQKQVQGQAGELSEEEMIQIRNQVWEDYVTNKILAREAEKFGLEVTEGEVTQALQQGTAPSLRFLAGLGFGNSQGVFDVKALNEFLKNKDKMIAEAEKQNPEYAEQIKGAYKLWLFIKGRLHDELLQSKYYALLGGTFISNPIAAKETFDNMNEQNEVTVAAVPYTVVADKDVTISEADLKEAYSKEKERFVMPVETRDIKYIDVQVVASPADRTALDKEMAEAYRSLQSTGDSVIAAVNRGRSTVPYVNMAMSKTAFAAAPEVQNLLDSMSVGAVRAPFYNAASNTITTFKLIAKSSAPDSVLYRFIVAPEDAKVTSQQRADSILLAVNGGAKFKDIAKKYRQTGDSLWLTSNQFESTSLPASMIPLFSKLTSLEAGQRTIIDNNGTKLVVEVLSRKAFSPKYNVAIVRRAVDFSQKTYTTELAKINKFLGENNSIESLEKNAGKAGYVVRTLDAIEATNALSFANSLGGENAKAAIRWAFDEADKGEISNLFECGRQNDHLLVMAVTKVNKKGYLPIDNPQVKEFLEALVKMEKKAAILTERLKGVKTFAQAQQQKGAVTETLSNITFGGSAVVSAVGVSEAALSGAIARTAVGKATGWVKGNGGMYFVQVNQRTAGSQKFDAKEMESQVGQMGMSFVISQSYYGQQNLLRDALMTTKAKVEDFRYRF